MQGQLRSPHTGPFRVRAAQRAAGARGMLCVCACGRGRRCAHRRFLPRAVGYQLSIFCLRSSHTTDGRGSRVAWRGVRAWAAAVARVVCVGATCTHARATHLPRDAYPVEVGVVEPEDRVDRRRRSRHHVAAEELVHLLVRVLVSHLRHAMGRQSGRVASGVCVGAEVTAAGLPKGRGWVLRLPCRARVFRV